MENAIIYLTIYCAFHKYTYHLNKLLIPQISQTLVNTTVRSSKVCIVSCIKMCVLYAWRLVRVKLCMIQALWIDVNGRVWLPLDAPMSEQLKIILRCIQFTAMLFLYCSLCTTGCKISVAWSLFEDVWSQSIYTDLKDWVHCWSLP